jgi:predicted transcriptional regulator YheO
MKTLHGKTSNDIVRDLRDEGILMTRDAIKITKLIVEAYGENANTKQEYN